MRAKETEELMALRLRVQGQKRVKHDRNIKLDGGEGGGEGGEAAAADGSSVKSKQRSLRFILWNPIKGFKQESDRTRLVF